MLQTVDARCALMTAMKILLSSSATPDISTNILRTIVISEITLAQVQLLSQLQTVMVLNVAMEIVNLR